MANRAVQPARSTDELHDLTGLIWTSLQRSDLAELGTLLTAIEHLDEPTERHSMDSLAEEFDEPGADPQHNAVLARDAGGTLVAYGWNHPSHTDTTPRRVYLVGGVHPGWRRQGIGTALFGWQLEQAGRWYDQTYRPSLGPLMMIDYVDEKLTHNRRLCEQAGLRAVRWFADMSLQLADALPTAPAPTGVKIVPFEPELSEGVRLAHNEAFADHWGSQPVDKVHWDDQLTRSAARPGWSWVALDEDSGEVVGYAMNSGYEQDWAAQGFSEGWTDRIGVRRNWRGRGIAQALLCASMKSFADAGLDAAGLGVDSDNPSGAFQLYEHLGYKTGDTVVMYAREENRGH